MRSARCSSNRRSGSRSWSPNSSSTCRSRYLTVRGPVGNWLTAQLNGDRRVAFPWLSLIAFLRISTHERASARPLTPEQAAAFVTDWLEPEVSWIPREGPGHARIMTDLITRYQLRGNIVSDAHLAALAIEHGLVVCSNDSDFARFSEVRWTNPAAPA